MIYEFVTMNSDFTEVICSSSRTNPCLNINLNVVFVFWIRPKLKLAHHLNQLAETLPQIFDTIDRQRIRQL